MSFGDRDLLWLLLLAPVMAWAFAWSWKRKLAALRAWASPSLWSRLGIADHPARRAAATALLFTALLGTTAALTRPRWGTHTESVERRGVDLVFVLDTSLSMAARDVHPDRLFVATSLLRRMAAELPGSRVALVQAEGEGLVLTPLTVDAAVLDLLLDPLTPSSLPVPGTRLRSALQQAQKLFPPGEQRGRAIVILSDGEDHGGGLEEIASKLHDASIRIYALGIGSPQGAPIPDGDSGQVTYKRDDQGRIVITKLHEADLEELTRETGGTYLRVTSAGADIKPVIRSIHRLATSKQEDQVVESSAERFQWPLGAAALALTALLAVPAMTSRAEDEA